MNLNEDPFSNFTIPLQSSTSNVDHSIPTLTSIVDGLYEAESESHKRYRSNMMNSLTEQSTFKKEGSAVKRPLIKNVSSNSYKMPSLYDSTLPVELLELFQPLYCKLCSVQLSSNVMAKLHYQSKNHDKRVKKFLIEYSERTGQPLHKRARECPKQENLEEETNPRNLYCADCDLHFTGKLHAESHYMGKNHQRVVSGKSCPTGNGSYDVNGKWIRRLPNKTSLVTSDGRTDNIGLDFTEVNSKETSTNLHCDICKVDVTSSEQMSIHLNGQRHQKQVKKLLPVEICDLETKPTNDASNVTTPCSTSFASYRTPSGGYYCNPCNISTNSEIQFKQHIESKKHKKKLATQKE